MAKVATLTQRHFPNVLTYLRHGITNVGGEALSATTQ